MSPNVIISIFPLTPQRPFDNIESAGWYQTPATLSTAGLSHRFSERHTQGMTVAIVKYSQTPNALAKAIQMCHGFGKLQPSHKVFIKPNIGWGLPGDTSPSRGIVVSAEILEQLVLLLRDFGCTDITVGEGSMVSATLGVNTSTAYAWAGTDSLAQKMGFRLVDLNQEEFVVRDFEGVQVKIARRALEADFFINVGLLRTHFMTTFAGAMKNLKGCLFYESKKDFHKYGKLHRFIALLGTTIRNDLIVVDGVWAQQQAPSTRRVHHTDLVLASTGLLEIDTVCAHLVGIEPGAIKYLAEYAQITGRSLDLNNIEVKGERVEEVRKPLPWVWDWPTDFKTRYDIKGITIQHPGDSMCSACSTATLVILQQFFRENRGATFDNVEFCVGLNPRAKDASERVILVGKCAIDSNKERQDAIKIGGCPPAGERVRLALDKYATKVTPKTP